MASTEVPTLVKPPEPQQTLPVVGEPPPAAETVESAPPQSSPLEPTPDSKQKSATQSTTPSAPQAEKNIQTGSPDPMLGTETAYTAINALAGGNLDPDAPPEKIIEAINANLKAANLPTWQLTDEIRSQITLAQKKVKDTQKSGTAAGVGEKQKADQPTRESSAEVVVNLDKALAESRTLVNLRFHPDRKIVEEYLTKLNGVPPDSDAVTAEVARRNEVLGNYPDLKQAFEIRDKAIAIQDKAEADYKKLLETHEALPADKRPPTPDKAKFLAQYYDEKSGLYWEVDAAGARIGEPIDFNRSLGPYTKALKRLAEEKVGDPSDFSPQAKEAQGLLKTLDLDKRLFIGTDGIARLDKSPKASEKINAMAKDRAEDRIKDRIQKAKTTDGKQQIIDIGVDGKIILHEELLDQMAPDEVLIGDEMLLGAYLSLDPKTHQTARENIMAQLHRRLIQRNPELFKDTTDMQVLTDRIQAIDTEIQKWLTGIDPQRAHNIPEAFKNNPVAMLAFVSTCRRAGLIVQEPGKQHPHLTERGADFFAKIIGKSRLEPDDTSFILTLATDENTDYADTFLSKHFGVSTETISDPKKRAEYVDLVMRDMEASGKITKEEMVIMRKISEQQISEVNLEKLAKKFGLPPQAGMGVLMLLLFLPMIQGVMDTGNETGGRGEGG